MNEVRQLYSLRARKIMKMNGRAVAPNLIVFSTEVPSEDDWDLIG